MRKIALYCRVSTAQQEKEQTIRTQIAKLRDVYKKEKIVKEYIDNGYSGAYLSRPALEHLREDAKRGLFDTICLYDLSRLARKLGYQIALIEEFEKLGIRIESLEEKFEDNPEGVLNRNIRGAIAEYERYKIARRQMDGKMRKLNEGRFIGCYPPYGYTLVKRTANRDAYFKINPKEAKIVRLIFRIYLDIGSITQTTKRLYEMGIKSRGGRGKKPAAFHKVTVRKILKNEVYIGNFFYRKYERCEAKYHLKENRKIELSGKRLRNRSEWKFIKIPSIIDKRIFNRAQEIINKNRREYVRPAKYFYLCQGLIVCTHCGRKYTTSILKPRGKLFLNYRCPQVYRNKVDEPPCHARTIGVRKLDSYVWEYISSLIRDADKLKEDMRKFKEKKDKEKTVNQKIYDSLILQKEEIKKKKLRLLDLYNDENWTKEVLDEKVSEVSNQEEELDGQIKEVARDLEKAKELDNIEEEIDRLCNQYKSNLPNPTPEWKKYTARKWIKYIKLPDSGGIVVRIRLPMPEKIPSNLTSPIPDLRLVPKTYASQDIQYRECL